MFERAVKSKSTEELEWIVGNPKDYQDDFLIAAQEELKSRNVSIKSEAFEARMQKLESIEIESAKSKKALLQLPNSIKWAANLVYLAIAIRLLNVFNMTITVGIGQFEFPYLNVVFGFLIMVYIASVIRKGHDIRKWLLLIVVLNSLTLLSLLITLVSFGFSLDLAIAAFSFISELMALVLLYHDDSRDWYRTLKKD